ncbi:MAG: hypothetical protein KGK03_08395 [Candidatus Omnitrophica bacterium]|nr:hypothetical protein [Candidatus Omnitrophota bacterium]
MQPQLIGFCVLGAYCFWASILGASFARLHLSVSFLNFPIFIGEGVMLFCLAISGWFLYKGHFPWTSRLRLFFAYLGYVVLWAGFDYFKAGGSSLALRNAEMFFYPVFAFFSYSFYCPALFSRRTIQLFFVVLLMALCLIGTAPFFSFLFFLLFFAVFFAMFHGPWKYFWGTAILVLWPYSTFFSGARTWLVSSVLTGLLLIFLFIKYFIKVNKIWRVGAGLAAAAIFLWTAFHFADRNGLKTLSTPVRVVGDYRRVENLIQQKSSSFHSEQLQVQPYNIYVTQPKPNNSQEVLKPRLLKKDLKKDLTEKYAANKEVSSRNLQTAYNDIIFRILIWQDMMQELWDNKSIFGVGLSHPQRSRSIEILGWASSEWRSVGWITPHNSFLDLIYRAGILGLGIIYVIFAVLSGLIMDFIAARSVPGILLSGTIIYGLIAANFLLILELPYYAIPFWSLFGLTLAYRRNLLPRAKTR